MTDYRMAVIKANEAYDAAPDDQKAYAYHQEFQAHLGFVGCSCAWCSKCRYLVTETQADLAEARRKAEMEV